MRKNLLYSFLLFILTASTAFAQTIIYVTPAGAGDNSGSSWMNAVPGNQLQDKINAAGLSYDANNNNTTQIWVATGTYTPTLIPVFANNNDRHKTFLLKNGVALYGGFKGDEVNLSSRNMAKYPTILSGDIDNTPDDDGFNSYHVVISSGNNNTAVLDGFIIEKGSADNPALNNLIPANSGSGMYSTGSSAILKNNIFRKNHASLHGGGIMHLSTISSSLTIINNVFYNNSAIGNGGGIYSFTQNGGPSLSIINSTFNSNTAGAANGGGAIFNNGSTPAISNSIVYGNTANGVANNLDGTNAVVSYSLIETGNYTNGGNNLPGGTNPMFVNSSAGDLRLKPGSAAINKGDNTKVPAAPDNIDITGKLRILNNQVDMGAYETIYPTGADGIIYVKQDASGNFSGDSWNNAIPEVADALEVAQNNNNNADNTDNITQVWVAKGTYKPLYKPAGSADSRDATFLLQNGLKLYGGFAGTETLLNQRNNITNNPTILSGDINNTPLTTTDDAYHVLVSVSNNSSAVLDGFIIEKGNANGGGNVTIGGLSTTQNNGGGIHLRSSSPFLINNIFRDNSALLNGGGVYSISSSSVISNTIFSKNKSTTGGAMYNSASAPLIINSTFNNNSTPIAGNG
ncbi:MAG: choice-of-anchor Q domain-containing protein, partial [Daejeonella sp.]